LLETPKTKAPMTMKKLLIEVKNLNKDFLVNGKVLSAAKDVSFEITEGETLALVGESGCGKTTIGKMLLKLIPPTSGEIFYKQENILKLNENEFKLYRKKMQMIFQDPFGSLNPRMTVRELIEEPLKIHKMSYKNVAKKLLSLVQMSQSSLDKFPHEFSGGQRQRIGIARALSLKPKFLILDEPVSALDVSIQAQIINLLKSLQEELKLTYLLISHDLSIVKHMSTKIAVMYLGEIVEIMDTKKLFSPCHHPYTRDLLASVMMLELRYKKEEGQFFTNEMPSPFANFSGCSFASLCPCAEGRCSLEKPLIRVISEGHHIKCHRDSEGINTDLRLT
jgi:oligopeptide/dipeptide ABC transporter ATP-binding protein